MHDICEICNGTIYNDRSLNLDITEFGNIPLDNICSLCILDRCVFCWRYNRCKLFWCSRCIESQSIHRYYVRTVVEYFPIPIFDIIQEYSPLDLDISWLCKLTSFMERNNILIKADIIKKAIYHS